MSTERRIDALEQRLARAWRADPGPELDAGWRAGVMDAVRAQPAGAGTAPAPGVERLVRNAFLAAAAAALRAVLTVGTRAAALDPTLEVAHLLAGDPMGLLQLALVL